MEKKKGWIIGGQDSMIWDVLMVFFLFYVIAMDLWDGCGTFSGILLKHMGEYPLVN